MRYEAGPSVVLLWRHTTRRVVNTTDDDCYQEVTTVTL